MLEKKFGGIDSSFYLLVSEFRIVTATNPGILTSAFERLAAVRRFATSVKCAKLLRENVVRGGPVLVVRGRFIFWVRQVAPPVV
ncbi:hypothetical protein H5U98_17665 [Mycolicibacterium boenickei]|uniref:Uncharacterized protein n=1 Tax=Mycolicibacterium boenickei TaxID=146017 RepID=A0AAX2ZQC8_9MYCO|nr:hypothetical protein [Mycolicibacterium boenickei]UNB97428.1 hypothetical protein H5U98_17665 [Mycolicibacterium boenickei]